MKKLSEMETEEKKKVLENFLETEEGALLDNLLKSASKVWGSKYLLKKEEFTKLYNKQLVPDIEAMVDFLRANRKVKVKIASETPVAQTEISTETPKPKSRPSEETSTSTAKPKPRSEE